MSGSLDAVKRIAMILAVSMGLPVATSDAASLPRTGAWAPASPPAPVESPAPAESVPVQTPTVEVAPPPSPSEPTVTPPADAPVATPPPEPSPTTEPPTTEPPPTEPQPAPEAFRTIGSTAAELPPSPPPAPGSGMRVGGGILIGVGGLDVIVGGIGLAAANAAEGVRVPSDVSLLRTIGTIPLVVGLAEVGAGVALAVAGVRRSRRLSQWQAQHSIAAPKTGNGMIVGGSILLGLGALDGLVMGINASQGFEVGPLDIVISVGELAAGAALLGVGLTRRKRYREWERSTFAPSFSTLPGGMTMGVSGRF